MNAPPDTAAALTWITNHQDFSAGTSCADSVYNNVTATPSVRSTAPTTHTPSHRRSVREAAMRYTSATAMAAPSENSYMLPSGNRSAASPRSTKPTISRPVASHVKEMAMFPDLRPGSSCDCCSVAVAPAGPTRTFWELGSGTRRAASDAANANSASAYTSIDA